MEGPNQVIEAESDAEEVEEGFKEARDQHEPLGPVDLEVAREDVSRSTRAELGECAREHQSTRRRRMV